MGGQKSEHHVKQQFTFSGFVVPEAGPCRPSPGYEREQGVQDVGVEDLPDGHASLQHCHGQGADSS